MASSNHLIIGLAGGIGSGKTAVSDYLMQKGVDVIDADVVARQVVQPGKPAWGQIRQHFGPEVLQQDQTLNRSWLRAVVFSNPDERSWLESVTHPAIRKEIIHQLNLDCEHYKLLVSPLLFESQQHHLCHRVLLVDVPEAIQRERACNRDNNSQQQVQAIINSQMSRIERNIRTHDVIVNDKDISALHTAVSARHEYYLELARQLRMIPISGNHNE